MKTIVVTGAAQGVGFATAALLARREYHVILLDIQLLEESVDRLRRAGRAAAEWGARGVRVNAVCPGWIKTEMDAADQGGGAYSDADIVNRVPMARFARPEDVAEAIAFLLNDELGGFINGVTLPVDGGWIADASWENLRISTRP